MSKPAHKLRDGLLQVTIWRNTGDNGNWYSVVPTRSYKPDNGDWQETDSLPGDDCLPDGRADPRGLRLDQDSASG